MAARMGHRGWVFTALALGAAFGPCAARAQAVPAGAVVAALAPVARPAPAFDLSETFRPVVIATTEAARQKLSSDNDDLRPEKVRIRWQYQPVEGGPRFEVGTIGSRKGAMKSKLLHVAMDWTF